MKYRTLSVQDKEHTVYLYLDLWDVSFQGTSSLTKNEEVPRQVF